MTSYLQGADLYNAALGMLTRRDHSRKELAQKLKLKFSVSLVELDILLDALLTAGYLDDERFTEAYTRARMRKGFGPERIKQELRAKGVEESVVKKVLSLEDLDWVGIAQTVWQKKYHQIPGSLKEKVRQANFLRYRGFSSAQLDSIFDVNH